MDDPFDFDWQQCKQLLFSFTAEEWANHPRRNKADAERCRGSDMAPAIYFTCPERDNFERLEEDEDVST